MNRRIIPQKWSDSDSDSDFDDRAKIPIFVPDSDSDNDKEEKKDGKHVRFNEVIRSASNTPYSLDRPADAGLRFRPSHGGRSPRCLLV